jgi:hypothetical protein
MSNESERPHSKAWLDANKKCPRTFEFEYFARLKDVNISESTSWD